MADTLTLDRAPDTAVLTFNNPDTMNGLDRETIDALLVHLDAIAADDDITYCVLQGAPGRFCVGGGARYLSWLASQSNATRCATLVRDQALTLTILRLPCLTAAVLDGLVAGAGVDLALAFDVRFASARARMNLAYARLGVIPDLGGLELLSQEIGPRRALAAYARSATWRTDDLCALGLAEPLAEPPRAALAWGALLRRRFAITRQAYRQAKLIAQSAWLDRFRAHQARVARTQAELMGAPAFAEAAVRLGALQKLMTIN